MFQGSFIDFVTFDRNWLRTLSEQGQGTMWHVLLVGEQVSMVGDEEIERTGTIWRCAVGVAGPVRRRRK